MKEQWPESYLNTWDTFTNDERSIKYATALLDHHVQKYGSIKMADVMSANGMFGTHIGKHISSKGGEVSVTYIDQSKVILETLSNAESLIADVTDLSAIPDGTFDIVVCRYGFNNLPKEKWEPALQEVLRVLKSGGVFLLQDHFVPGAVFSELINEAEQYLAKMEGKQQVPFIYSTEEFNTILDKHPMVKSRVKVGYGFFINIWDRLKAKKDIIPDFEKAKKDILDFYATVCLEKYKLLIVDPEEYIHVYNVTYAIVKR